MVRAANSDSAAYRKAFEAYLRYGTPIDLATIASEAAKSSAKAASVTERHPTTHYIWRTRRDDRVRPSHRENEGKVFAWDDPPPTGHPGEAYGCRCWAEPYIPVAQEFFKITMQDVADEGAPWDSDDFVYHYFFGGGRTVTLRETGHLRAVVAEFQRQAGDVPTKLPGQIADEARKIGDGSFGGKFDRSYNMTRIVFSLGRTKVSGPFRGTVKRLHPMVEFRGAINFELRDAFRDPLDIDRALQKIGAIGAFPTELPASKPYPIIDDWTGTFEGRVHLDRSQSGYRYEPSG
ncbi:phage minor head protein [Methyloligella sp. 2.7D]|uniref:phage minor head protein n=1 Tax=unclassified Methyloligella TaxID=2625955 RepID=UPI00157BBF00|nr:phage minor head protein [Methyloligella sp. GL2]QKP76494.1 minor capsid protein [Methyloligella sp. GL2]